MFSLFTYLVLTFRELVYQIADQFRVFGSHIGLKDAVIVGGIGEVHNHLEMPPTAPSLFDSQSFSASSVQYNERQERPGIELLPPSLPSPLLFSSS